jgi:general secretion pathway protein K
MKTAAIGKFEKRESRSGLWAGGALRNDTGMILIALLWILTALSVIALSFAREGYLETEAAHNAQAMKSAHFIAQAGIAETAYKLIWKRASSSLQTASSDDTVDPLDLGKSSGSLNGGEYNVDVQDESGKLSVNYATEDQLRALLAAVEFEQADIDVIADSILDWRDLDKAPKPNGAEDDYYQSLNPPYKARNGALEIIEELLLIRGVTPEFFYGRPEKRPDGSKGYKYGLSRYLTVYATNGGSVNVNCAPIPVLMSAGLPADVAQAIYERRQTKPFKNMVEFRQEFPGASDPQIQRYLNVAPSRTYTLTSSARAANSKAKSVIRAVINLDQAPYKVVYWNENVLNNYEGMMP